jgi:hypothetical protein
MEDERIDVGKKKKLENIFFENSVSDNNVIISTTNVEQISEVINSGNNDEENLDEISPFQLFQTNEEAELLEGMEIWEIMNELCDLDLRFKNIYNFPSFLVLIEYL